jgi:hypothetical protein
LLGLAGLVRFGSAGPEWAQWSRIQSKTTRNERHRKSTNGSSGEAEKTKMAKLETTQVQDYTIAQRKEGNGSGTSNTVMQAEAVMTAAMAVRAVQGRTRRLAEAGRRGF